MSEHTLKNDRKVGFLSTFRFFLPEDDLSSLSSSSWWPTRLEPSDPRTVLDIFDHFLLAVPPDYWRVRSSLPSEYLLFSVFSQIRLKRKKCVFLLWWRWSLMRHHQRFVHFRLCLLVWLDRLFYLFSEKLVPHMFPDKSSTSTNNIEWTWRESND